MVYSESEARRLIIEAGHKFVEAKLIARTWGNISARISDEEFIITPSGRGYEDLKEEELVKVRIDDCSYEGHIKPSSEKGLHAGIYQLRKDANFIVHTHQHYASAICAEEKDVPFAPCAKYGFSGTDKLRDNVMLSVAIHLENKAFLMAKHGAVCFGNTYEEAFEEAFKLEENSKILYEATARDVSEAKMKKAWIDDYAQLVGFGRGKSNAADIEAEIMVTEKNRAAARYVTTAKPLPITSEALERGVYLMKYSKLKNKNK